MAREQPEHMTPDFVLRQVRRPAEFIEELRSAYEAELARRDAFVDALTPDVKAEWINGQAVYRSPAREAHNAAVNGLATALNNYSLNRTRLLVRIEKAMIALAENRFEPDICVWVAAHTEIAPDTVLYPRPDLVVEVLSEKTRHRDLGDKRVEYGEAGTHEYWVVDADARTLRQLVQRDGVFEEAHTYGVGEQVDSELLPDLELPIDAVFDFEALRAFGARMFGAG